MIHRKIDILSKKSFFLFGARQTGKSTLLRQLFSPETTIWYNLLEEDVYQRLLHNPSVLREDVLNRTPAIQTIVIDEVQRIPALLNEVHGLLERPNPPQFVLTGSSARSLKQRQANLLAGRALTYHLFPLTQEELGDQFQLERALRFGTLPAIYLEGRDNEATVIEELQSYVQTYITEEVQREARLRSLDQFIRFLPLAAAANGGLTNFSSIAQHLGISYITVRGYYEILEDTLLGYFLFPYSNSMARRLSKQPKFYFFDTGVARALQQLTKAPLLSGTAAFGHAFEHWIVLEIMRLNRYMKADCRLSFYRTSNGTEVDVIIEYPNGRVSAVEIKAKTNIQKKDLRGLSSFHELVSQARLYCVSLDPYPRTIDQVMVLPYRNIASLFETA